ncbi:hypothetical protein AB4K20DRAFT_1862695 [Rhizopus microsporus]
MPLLDDYQTEIRILKKQGFTVIGYTRKSKSDEDIETRTRLLNLMYKRLKERSLVDHITYFDSIDVMRFITNTENVCLVALDYAGLSTSSNDLYGFLNLIAILIPFTALQKSGVLMVFEGISAEGFQRSEHWLSGVIGKAYFNIFHFVNKL